MRSFIIATLIVLALGCAREQAPPQVPPPAGPFRPDPIQSAAIAGKEWRAEREARQTRSAIAECAAKAIEGGKDPASPEVALALKKCQETAGKSSEAERVRMISAKAFLECVSNTRKAGKTEEEAAKSCADKPYAGIRFKDDPEEESGGSSSLTPTSPPIPLVPARRMLIGRVGAAVPTGWTPGVGWLINPGETPWEWDRESGDNVPYCHLELKVDGLPVWWTDGASLPRSVPVPPGTGMAPVFGGFRTSVLPAGESGYIRFDRVIEPDGRVAPHYPSSHLHVVESRCWRYSVLPETSAGVPRFAEYAVLEKAMPPTSFRSGAGWPLLDLPGWRFRSAPPLPTRPL